MSTVKKIQLSMPAEDDIVTINAGGKTFQALRSTLCLPPNDTAFTNLFSENTHKSFSYKSRYNTIEAQTDSNGTVFLDQDPELIEIILNFLRLKKLEDPFDPVDPPRAPEHKTKAYRKLLNHFDLTAFFYYPSTSSKTNAVVLSSTPPTANTTSRGGVAPRRNSFEIEAIEDATVATEVSSSEDYWNESFSQRPEDEAITVAFDNCYG
jgi:uncharacterized membrane protein